MGKGKQQSVRLTAQGWQRLAEDPAQLTALLKDRARGVDIARQLTIGLQPGGELACSPLLLRLQAVALLEQHAVELCGDAPQDVLRALYEAVRERTATAAGDGPEGAARGQLVALRVLTSLLVQLDMPQRDARLVKVHVELLSRIMEGGGPHAGVTPELRRCAAACLWRMEEGAPTLLLAGSRQLLELARAETSGAAESYVMLAACVLSHGASRCLDQATAQRGAASDEEAAPPPQAAPPLHHAHHAAQQPTLPAVDEHAVAADAADEAFRALATMPCPPALPGACQAGSTGSLPVPGAASPFMSPSGTLDDLATIFASGRTVSSSAAVSLRSDPESCSSPAEPSSPRGVASLIGTLSTLDSASHDSHSRALAAAAQDAPSPGAHSAPAGHTVLSELSGIVQLDGSAAQPLLGAGGHGLRHFYVPQHLAWPDALGQGALAVYLPPGAHEDVQRAALEFVAALPRLSADGVACVTAALPPILRLADLPPDELGDALDALLHLGRTLLLQAVLKLHAAVPEGLEDWQAQLQDSVLMMVNGPHPTEQRVVAITWALVQHHSQLHGRQASLFAGAWRQLLPRPDDPPQLLGLKVKALSACLAVGIGRAEQILPMVFAWDGFWAAVPTDQQLRLATYALRMLGSAAVSYGALPAEAVARCRRCTSMSTVVASFKAASRPAATPHYVTACLISAAVQLVGTRPQYLPAVEAFLCTGGGAAHQELRAALLNALDALFSAAATGGMFAALQPAPRASLDIARQHSGGRRGSGPPSPTDRTPSPGGSGLGSVLRRMKTSLSMRFSPSSETSPEGSLQAAAELGSSVPLAPIVEAETACVPPPQLPAPLETWEEAAAWCWDSRMWAPLSASMLQHDPMVYRPLLMLLAQSGTALLPMGTLRLLASYAAQYQGEGPAHVLPAKEAGSAVLAICQAAAVTHLLIGPAAGAAGTSTCGAAASPATPTWTAQQEEVALAMQAVLSALTSHFPAKSVRRRAQSFLDLLSNPSAWDLKLRVSTMAKLLGGYFSDAVSAANYL